MKRLAALFILCLSLSAVAGWSDWFTPISDVGSEVTGTVVDKTGEHAITYNPKTGKITSYDGRTSVDVSGIVGAMALEALENVLRNNTKLQGLAENLEELFFIQGINIRQPDGSAFNVKFNGGTIKDALTRGSTMISSNTDKNTVETDGITIEKDSQGKLQLKNAGTSLVMSSLGDLLDEGSQVKNVPVLENGSVLKWYKIGKLTVSNDIDNLSLGRNEYGKLEIKGASEVELEAGTYIPNFYNGDFFWDPIEDLFDGSFELVEDKISLAGLAEAGLGDLYGKIGDGAAGFMTLGEAMDAVYASPGDALMADGMGGVYWGPVVSSVAVNGEEQPNESGAVDISGVAKSVVVNGTGPFHADATGVIDLGMLTASDGTNGTAAADGKSIFLKPPTEDATAQYEINGWSDAEPCAENLLGQLTAGVGLSNHEVLCRVGGKGGLLHFLPMTEPDDKLARPDEGDFKLSSDGTKFSIKPGTAGKYLKSTATGTTWDDAVSAVESGDTSKLTVSTDSSGKVTITPVDGGDVTVAGNQGGNAQSGQKIRFESASDSNVKIWVEKSGSDIVVKIGVYYK